VAYEQRNKLTRNRRIESNRPVFFRIAQLYYQVLILIELSTQLELGDSAESKSDSIRQNFDSIRLDSIH